MFDIVQPGNEEALIERAKLLRLKPILLYNKPHEKVVDAKTAVIVKPGKATKLKGKSDYIIVQSSSKDRQVIERDKPFMIIGVGEIPKVSNKGISGINQVVCNLAKKNKVAFGFSLSTLFSLSSAEQAELMNRWMQIGKLAKKYDVDCYIVSCASMPSEMRDADDIRAFARVLGIQLA